MNRSVDNRLNTFQSTRKKQITQHNVSEHNTQWAKTYCSVSADRSYPFAIKRIALLRVPLDI